VHLDDALAYIVQYVKSGQKDDAYFGYEVYLSRVIEAYLKETRNWPPGLQYAQDHPQKHELSTAFFDAAWDLCRRGILRPSVRFLGGQGSPDGSGFTVTTLGRRWIEEQAAEALIGGPDRIGELFKKFSDRLGLAFLQRATEAAYCHAFGVYLACCAMCGAAAESILLATAIAKTGDEAKVLSSYRTAGGRQKVINSVVGQTKLQIGDPFRSAMGLLSYWRDDAAHGLPTTISEIEAHEALARLLRFAQFTTENWAELTQP
jgi:hypothetical protein